MRERSDLIRLGLPKGHMEAGVVKLFTDAGIKLQATSRTYRPAISLPGFEVKVLKPQNVVEMLHFASRDIGFAGADWVEELQAEVIELLDTTLDPVRLVVAAPRELLDNGELPARRLIVASEYERIAKTWIARSGVEASFVRSYGATEVFPPEDADCILDNSATGATLRANGLEIVEEVMTSSTRLYANPAVLDSPEKRAAIEDLVMVLKSVLDARRRVMLEVNVSAKDLESVVAVLPSMREATISPLHGNSGFAVKAAVPKNDLPTLVPLIKARGGEDIVVTAIAQIVA